MKNFLIILFLIASTSLFAFSYPPTMAELFSQLVDSKRSVEIITGVKYHGTIIVSQTDYFVMKLEDGDIVIIPYVAIKEVSML